MMGISKYLRWLRSSPRNTRSTARPKTPRWRPALEYLEDRVVPSILINFDDVAGGTVINSQYPGVTFSFVDPQGNPTSTNVCAVTQNSFAYSSPNVVGPGTNGFAFDQDSGSIQAQFASLQRSVSIQAAVVTLPEGLGEILDDVFLEAFDANHNPLGTAWYPIDRWNYNDQPYQTLTVSSASNNIAYVQFSATDGDQGPAILGEFDNLQYAAAGSFQVTPAAPPTAGTPFNITVASLDQQGNPLPSYTGTVHFTSSDPQAVLPADYTFTGGDAGAHTFAVTLKSTGRQTITVTDTASPSMFGTSETVTTFAPPTPSSQVTAITAGPDGNLWFTEGEGNKVGKINPATGAITEFPLPTAGAAPGDITAGPDGNVWFTEPGANIVAEINPNTGAITQFSVPTAQSYPWQIAAGPDGNVWFTELVGHKVAKINPATGQITEYAVPRYYAITAGPDGNLWTAQGGTIDRISPSSGQITEFPLNTAGADVNSIISGPDGNLWFTDQGLNQVGKINPLTGAITEFPVPTGQNPGTWQLNGISAGPDGNLFALEVNAQTTTPTQVVYNAYVDEVTPTGVIRSDFVLPATQGGSFGLASGPDGNLWVARFSAIARLTPGIRVSPGAATQFAVSAPALAGAGTPFPFTVTARDAYGNVATGYTGTVHLTSSDPHAALPSDYTFRPADAGVHTFSVTLNTLGGQTVTAADSVNGLQVTSPAIPVVAGPATHFRVASAAATATAGTALSVTVTALDADNNVATGYTGTVHLSSTDAKAVLPAAYAFTAKDQGTHKFNVTLKTAGPQTVTVSGTDLPAGAVSAWRGEGNAQDSIGGNNGTLQGGATFAPGEAGQAFSFNGSTAYVSVPYSSSLALNTFTVSAWVNPAANPGSFGILGTRFGGEYTFDVKLWGNKVHGDVGNGSSWISTSVDYPATLTPGTWHLITYVIDNAAKQFSLYLDGALQTTIPFSGTPLLMTPGETLGIGQDYPGEYWSGLLDEVQVYNRALAAAEVQGIYLNGSAGEFQANTGSASATVNPAAAKTFGITGLPASATAGTAVSFTVTAKDAYGNVATGYRGIVHFTSTDPKAVLPANYTFIAGDAGTHTFTAKLTFKTAGTQTLTAKDTVAGTITGKATSKVVAGAATHLLLSAPATATAGVAFTVTVTAQDAYGNTATGYRGTVHFTSTDPAATLPKDYTFAATSAGKHSFSVTLRTTGKQTIDVADLADPAIGGSATVTI
jgi:streptogramin lyase